MEIYHLKSGAIGWGPEERRQAGDVLIDPPDRIVERYEHKLDRLDDGNGKLPRGIIDELPEFHLRRIARLSDGPIDENSDLEEIISMLESNEDSGLGDVERQAAEVVENLERDGPLERQTDAQAEGEGQYQGQDQERKQTLRRGDEQNAVDPEVEAQTEEILDEIDDRRERLAAEDEDVGVEPRPDADAEDDPDAAPVDMEDEDDA